MGDDRYRLSVLEGGEWHRHRHPEVYGQVEGGGIAAASSEPIRLMLSLLDALVPPVTLRLEILEPEGLTERDASWTTSPSVIREWLEANATWLEGDARLAVSVCDSEGQSARFDEHDLIWLEGDLGRFEPFLLAGGLLPGEVTIPYPHAHQYREEWTPLFDRMLARLAD